MKEINLTHGRVAKVDNDMYDFLSRYHYHYECKKGKEYAVRSFTDSDGQGHTAYMHQDVMGVIDGLEIHHVNDDGLDNQRQNLAHCTHKENMRHRIGSAHPYIGKSGYRGVTWNKHQRAWQAAIYVGEKRIYSCGHATAESAALVWNEWAQQYYRDAAKLNTFPIA